ncbi:hypothetical protein D3C76_888390 [compost metagenome]
MHQFWQPGAESVHHQQAAEKRQPQHEGVELATITEQLANGDAARLAVGKGQAIIGLRLMVGGSQAQQAACLFYMPGAQQEVEGFGQLANQHRQDQQGNHRHKKDSLPAPLRDQQHAQARRQHPAY